jgi:uncharacterized membrane protein YuzA (DUF378 family)
MHFMGFMVSIGGLILANVFSLGSTTSTYIYGLIGIGGAISIMSIAFAISLQCIMKSKNPGSQVGAYPNNTINNTNSNTINY